jgi:hypothetical protein
MHQVGNRIIVDDKMQRGYEYTLSEPIGENFLPGFDPYFTPAEMLSLGVFEGKYCNDCKNEFPNAWFANALVSDQPNPDLNYFGIKSRQSLLYWKSKGWVYGPDPRGWFQWYCRRCCSGQKVAQFCASRRTNNCKLRAWGLFLPSQTKTSSSAMVS